MHKILATLAVTLSLTGFAQAATLTYHGHHTVTLNNFDLNATTGLSNGMKVFQEKKPGEGLYLNGPANLTLTYLGSEAGHTNIFRIPTPSEIFRNTTTPIGGQSHLNIVAGGLLKFSFFDLVACLGIKNGQGSNDHKNSIAVFMESAMSAIVLFNDLGNDKDYDDMAVRVQISPVPVPAALPLLASALGGMGYFARRRKTKT
jgi:hypothetical protein